MATKAGKKVTEKNQAATTPIAVTLPRSWRGGTPFRFRLAKPTTVVRLVKNTGCQFARRLDRSASSRVAPFRIALPSVTRM